MKASRLKNLFRGGPTKAAPPVGDIAIKEEDVEKLFGSRAEGTDYYPALFARLRPVNGETVQSSEDEKTARIIEAITTRVIFEDLRERKLTCMLSLGKKGEYQAIVAGRFSAHAKSAYEALLTAFMHADKGGLFATKPAPVASE